MYLIAKLATAFEAFLLLIGWHMPRSAPAVAPLAPPQPEPGPEPGPEPAAATPSPRIEAATDAEEAGRYYYFGDVLDRLDDYFAWLELLRKDDPEAFTLYAKIGGTFGPRAREAVANTLEPIVAQKLPAFALTNFEGEDSDDKIQPKLIYFKKLNGFAPIQRTKGAVYRGDMFYVTKDEPGKRLFVTFFVGVDQAGEIIPLKIDTTVNQKVGKRRKAVIHHRKFSYPEGLLLWSREAKLPIENLVRAMFCWTMNSTLQAESGLTVRATKNGMTARFAIDLLRTPYFFKDRDKHAENGKKIFHIVRAHERATETGRKTIRTHFRGLRQFDWKGYAISISLAGLHHKPLYEFTAKSYDANDPNAPKPKDCVESDVLAAQIGQALGAKRKNDMRDLAGRTVH